MNSVPEYVIDHGIVNTTTLISLLESSKVKSNFAANISLLLFKSLFAGLSLGSLLSKGGGGGGGGGGERGSINQIMLWCYIDFNDL